MTTRYKCVVSNVQATAHAAAHPAGEYVKWSEYEELQVEIAHWRATVSESDAHRDLWRRRAEACGWPTEADMDAAREPT